MKRSVVLLLLLLVAVPIPGHAAAALPEPYHATEQRGVDSYRTAYVRSGSWHVTFTEQFTGSGTGTRWAVVERITAPRHPETRIHGCDHEGIRFQLWHFVPPNARGQARTLFAEPGRSVFRDSFCEVTAGDRRLTSSRAHTADGARWQDDEARRVIAAALEHGELRFRFVDGQRRVREGVTATDDGLREALATAARFTGVDVGLDVPVDEAPAGDDPAATEPLVVLLVRHAEKADEGRDPALTPAGRARAESLARAVRSAGVDAVHSTGYVRTVATATPTATALGLEVERYDPRDLPGFVARLRAAGGRHLVVGHSNTTPAVVALLGGDAGTPIDEAEEYDRLYVVTVAPDGTVSTVLLRY